MKIVGLTGGIGSGKSTVAHYFEKLAVPVYYSDNEAKKLMVSSKNLKKSLIKLLGERAYSKGALNKKYIAKKIFKDAKLLEQMNALVHPAVRNHFLKWAESQKTPYVIQETALLFENLNPDFYDAIILVTAPEKVRVERVMLRDDSTKEAVMNRIDIQIKDEEKIPFSNYIIENLELKKTKQKVAKVHRALLDNSEEIH